MRKIFFVPIILWKNFNNLFTKFIRKFITNGISHWEKDASAPTLVPHYFGLRDFEDVKQIRDAFENIITEYVDKVIIQNSW